MASIKVKLRKSTVPGKPGSIYYQLTQHRQTRQLTTRIRLYPAQWDAAGQRVISSGKNELAIIQNSIDSDVESLRDMIRESEVGGTDSSAQHLAAQLRSRGRHKTVLEFFREQIESMTACNRLGTAGNYRRAMNSFSDYLGGADIPFSALTERLVEGYNAYLLRRGVVRNTVSFYMRILRSVYNKAVRNRLTEQTFPFLNVYTGIDRTHKRAVDQNVIARLIHLNLSHSASLSLARDLFVFSYYTRGMAFIDMAYLQKKNIQGDVIRYTRHKTGQQISIRMEPCMSTIISRYAAKRCDSRYVLPILRAEETRKAYAQYQCALNYYNRQLKRLTAMLGIDLTLSSYTSRHSWATAARNLNVPISVISAGMGHTSERTTQIYLTTLEDSVIDSANQGIIDSLSRVVSM